MANGYETGDYLGRFLAQLPQIYQMQQNMKLQEERLNLQKQTALENQQYRQQLAEQNKKTQAYNEFNQVWDAASGNKEVQQMLIKQHPYVKENPQIVDALNEGFDIQESMKGQVYALGATEPEQRMLAARQLLQSPHMTSELFTTTQEAIKAARDEMNFTMQELAETEHGIEYANLAHMMENPGQYLTAGEDVETFLTTVGAQMTEVRNKGRAEYQKSYGAYPTIEGIGDDEIDGVLRDIYDEDIAAGIRQGPLQEPPDTTTVKPDVQTAGFPMKRKSKTKKEKPLFVEDEAGLESLVKEYAPQASLGILEKAAEEGSIIKPVSNPVFKAIDGAMDTLSVADSTLRTLSNPAARFDAFSYQGKQAGGPEKWNSRYEESAGKFKKTLKDMYNLYLRLDPKKGAYQGKFLGGGNEIMRKKIRKQLERYKKAGGKGKYSPYQYDKEIQSILEKIKF